MFLLLYGLTYGPLDGTVSRRNNRIQHPINMTQVNHMRFVIHTNVCSRVKNEWNLGEFTCEFGVSTREFRVNHL